ncbi:MAG: hypothetical protein HC881_01545 [Leptolyngbyaceae cyanobacterium SL_7_1]|nr:hypothetical protein [Leptolyngbyaceae cyanobacterium SL_7_1]
MPCLILHEGSRQAPVMRLRLSQREVFKGLCLMFKAELPPQCYQVFMMLSTNRIPAGFRIISETPDLWIRYRSKGTGLIVAFMVPFVLMFIGFLLSGFFTLQEALQVGLWQSIRLLTEDGSWSLFLNLLSIGWFFFCLWIFSIPTLLMLWFIFGITEFRASQDSLVVVHRFLGFSSKKQILSHTIQSFVQIKDGGENMDSFPSWRLFVIANPKVWLLARQPIEKSDWLGRVLADFYRVQFVPSENR